ncbi:hypothetical protein C0991_005701, partial [Blastosporella zonata]
LSRLQLLTSLPLVALHPMVPLLLALHSKVPLQLELHPKDPMVPLLLVLHPKVLLRLEMPVPCWCRCHPCNSSGCYQLLLCLSSHIPLPPQYS